MNDKYDQCPLLAAGFELHTFEILPPMIIGADGKCICTHADRCLDVDRRSGERCTLADLNRLDDEAVARRGWQS